MLVIPIRLKPNLPWVEESFSVSVNNASQEKERKEKKRKGNKSVTLFTTSLQIKIPVAKLYDQRVG